ncbi:MAG: hypothetical protein HRK26_05275 [Rickettsiaceae bacterium H1]|nr:hypothetical protein [Rickettsiaceae bacterium H1]
MKILIKCPNLEDLSLSFDLSWSQLQGLFFHNFDKLSKPQNLKRLNLRRNNFKEHKQWLKKAARSSFRVFIGEHIDINPEISDAEKLLENARSDIMDVDKFSNLKKIFLLIQNDGDASLLKILDKGPNIEYLNLVGSTIEGYCFKDVASLPNVKKTEFKYM